MRLFEHIDPRLREAMEAEFLRRGAEPCEGIPRGVKVVLVGHRGAGKSAVLPEVAQFLGLPAVDLDVEIGLRTGKSTHALFEEGEVRFRALEGEVFAAQNAPCVIAVGGGFLSHHAALLKGTLPVLIPISEETYRERLRADTSRPRLRPERSLEEELTVVFRERETLHRGVTTVSLIDFLLRARRGFRARRVVTLPANVQSSDWAQRAFSKGAELLEVRTDLHRELLKGFPLLVAARGPPLPNEWSVEAVLNDVPLPSTEGTLVSLHSSVPLSPAEAVEKWASVPLNRQIKHVEPVASFAEGLHLLETQRLLIEQRGPHRVTVLATGDQALPLRALLSERNALDYLALTFDTASAPGQRLLTDARRVHRFAPTGRARLGILGSALAFSNSARCHEQPFDRIQLPAETDLEPLLKALRPYFRGFAVTTPFKNRVAALVGAELEAVNTLVRTSTGWRGVNTDIAGARAALEFLGGDEITVLGGGGASTAVMAAARSLGKACTCVRRAEVRGPLTGTLFWTWRPDIEPPPQLRFEGARVAVISYGKPGRLIAERVRALGGTPVPVGLRWFLVQARAQRELWRTAT